MRVFRSIGLGLLLVLLGAHAEAQDRPLLVEGKTTLYQRVLARPGAVLHETPGGPTVATPVRPFDVFYVFAREGDWVETGRAAEGPRLGWLLADKVIDWNQAIVVSFSNPAGRERTLLFQDQKAIVDLLNSEDLVAQVRALREQAIAGTLPGDSTVVSIEPETYVDIQEQFYILPILRHELTFNPLNYEELKLLEVASIPQSFTPTQEPPAREEILRDFKVGVLFVIDSTISMGPYIEQTRAAVEDLYRRIADSEIGERVSFGLIAFRDSTELVPALEYVTKTFVELEPNQEPGLVLQGLAEVTEATASSVGFNEDAYAGIDEAVSQVDWNAFGGRFVVLITDAGPNPARESAIAERADAAALSAQAREQGIAIYTMHLRTPAGAGTHAYAEGEYRELSRALGSNAGDRYQPIEGGSPEALGASVAQLAGSIVTSVQQAMDGRVAEALEAAGDDLAQTAALDTLAMQLAYLGRLQDERAPDVFKAWIADRALENTTQTAVEVRLLITKDQLNTLRDVLREIVDAGEATRTDSAAFFDQVRGALAALARGDEGRLVNAQFETLGGALGEFLDGLPYRSPLMELTPERWLNTSSVEQRVILDRLRSRLRLFERVHDEPANWTALYDDAPPGETVYAMPLSFLP
ncbi:MAG TPA: vWA domain-containing protein [Geminicoccaceae bacterium]|nr:vWA domain-containing protein [Geminicoccaceae bacterium]